ncbi:MAG: hypothetical protein Q9201_001597 [Fulgogasparrea decipioides]
MAGRDVIDPHLLELELQGDAKGKDDQISSELTMGTSSIHANPTSNGEAENTGALGRQHIILEQMTKQSSDHYTSMTTIVLRQKCADNVDSSLLNSFHAHLTPYQLQCLLRDPYDNCWMSRHYIDPQVLQSFVAKQKLECLVLHGVLKVGDYMTVQDMDWNEGISAKYALITAGIKTNGKRFPDFAIATIGPSGFQARDLIDCKGPSAIIEMSNALQPSPNTISNGRPWKALCVYRGDEFLGTLYDVRQAFGYYQMLMDGFVGVSGKRSRVLGGRKSHSMD